MTSEGVTEIRTDGDVIMWVENWAPSAACRQASPDQLFVRGAEQNKAEWGVWGGMTERERRALLRRRPTASWRAVLEAAREQETKGSKQVAATV